MINGRGDLLDQRKVFANLRRPCFLLMKRTSHSVDLQFIPAWATPSTRRTRPPANVRNTSTKPIRSFVVRIGSRVLVTVETILLYKLHGPRPDPGHRSAGIKICRNTWEGRFFFCLIEKFYWRWLSTATVAVAYDRKKICANTSGYVTRSPAHVAIKPISNSIRAYWYMNEWMNESMNEWMFKTSIASVSSAQPRSRAR